MPKIQDVKVRKYGDWYVVTGGDPRDPRSVKKVRVQSRKQANEIAGARRRMIIKRALRKVGVKRMPRSLTKHQPK